MLIKFRILENVLADQSKHNLWNRKSYIAERSLLADRCSCLSQESLNVFSCEECISLLHCHVEEFPCVHDLVVLPFLRCLLFFLCFRLRLSFLFELIQLGFKFADLFIQVLLCCLVLDRVLFKGFDRFSYDRLFLFGLGLLDGCLKLGISGLELCVLPAQLLERLPLLVELFFSHQCSQCHS